jgi:hypothetical protein
VSPRRLAGTPLTGDSAADLQGQLLALHAYPLCLSSFFKNAVSNPFKLGISLNAGFGVFLVRSERAVRCVVVVGW